MSMFAAYERRPFAERLRADRVMALPAVVFSISVIGCSPVDERRDHAQSPTTSTPTLCLTDVVQTPRSPAHIFVRVPFGYTNAAAYLSPSNLTLLHLARQQYAAGDWQASFANLKALLKSSPNCAEAIQCLEEVQFEMRKRGLLHYGQVESPTIPPQRLNIGIEASK